MKDFYKKYYTTEVLNKIKKFGYNGDCSPHIIDIKEDEEVWDEPCNKTCVNFPTPEEFFEWILNNYEYYISIIPEDDYKRGNVFRYNIYKKDYDDHFNLIKSETNFYTHCRAVCYSVYDLLMNINL
jgi:hypothetical protein